MNQFLILVVCSIVFANAEDDSFSIGLGVLSPSYSQTVGKENVKVKFDQKENGAYSYSVGDPSGTHAFSSFGEAAKGYSAPSGPSGFAAPAPNGPAGYAAPAQAYNAPTGYGAPAQAYNAPTGYAAPASAYNAPTGYAAPAPAYNAYNPGPQAYGNNGFQAAARKPESGNILPAGFSYHATDGQAFLGSMGESKTFMVEDSPESARGPAEQSFYHNRAGLQDGLVGYGPGGPSRGGLPIGGYAGPQYQGAHREHGGHTK